MEIQYISTQGLLDYSTNMYCKPSLLDSEAGIHVQHIFKHYKFDH